MIGALLRPLGGLALAGLKALPGIGPVISFFSTALGRLVAIGLAALVLYQLGAWQGAAHANRQCEAAALEAKLAAVEVERDVAQARLKRDGETIAELQQLKERQEKEIALLKGKTKPGGADAYLDEHCNYTERGARRGVRK